MNKLKYLSFLGGKEKYRLICSCWPFVLGIGTIERWIVIDMDIFYGEMICEGFVGIFKWVKWAL